MPAQVGNVLTGKVATVKAFGAFVDVGLAQHALIHAAQISEHRITDVGAVFKQGDSVKVGPGAAHRHGGACSPAGLRP